MRPLSVALACTVSAIVGAGYGAVAHKERLPPFNLLERYSSAQFAAVPSSDYDRARRSFFEAFPANREIVMVGDSITERADWSAIFPGRSIANRGISWDTTYGVLDRLPGIMATHASTAFVMIGTNDAAYPAETGETIFARYSKIVDTLSASMKVFVQSTLLRSKDNSVINAKILDLNSRMQSYCDTTNRCSFIDLNKALAPDGFLSPINTVDGVHLTGHGYVAWRDAIAQILPNTTPPKS